MKITLYLFIFLNCLISFGQRKDVAIKIYLQDAYSGKNINDAKVTLEGFEIPEIVGTYDKKGKFYYFTEIPEGYNTVMAYHKNYNEKGFQQLRNSFPKELKLRLYDHLNVMYELKNGSMEASDLKSKSNFHCNIYVEDPYKIAIAFDENCKKIMYDVLKLCPELEAINPYYKYNSKAVGNFSCDEFTTENNYPTRGGYSNFSSRMYSASSGDYPVLMFRKKSGLKFKRFNDPILYRLSINNISPLVIVNLKVKYRGSRKYKRDFTKKLDSSNYNGKDSRAMIYKTKITPLIGKNKFLYSEIIHEPTGETIQSNPHRYFYLLWNYKCDTFYAQNDKGLDASLINLKYFGLGFLDQLEYFSRSNHLTITDEMDQIIKNCNY